METVRTEGAECKGKEKGDHAGCAQYADARDKVVKEFVQGCVRTEGVGDGEYEEAEEECDVGFFAYAREGEDGEEERDDADVFRVPFEGVASPVFVRVCVKADKFGDDEGEYFFGVKRPG